MPSAHHERIVESLRSRGCEVGGFQSALKKLIVKISTDPEEDARDLPRVNPDAWRIDHDDWRVYCYEVDTSCFLTPGKWSVYLSLAWLLDGLSWRLNLVRVDAFGNINDFPTQAALIPQAHGDNTDPSANPEWWCARWAA